MTQIRVELELVDGSFTSGILRSGQTLAQFNQELLRTNPRLAGMENAAGSVIRQMSRLNGETKGVLATLRDVSIVTGVVGLAFSKASALANGWLGDIVRVNAEMEKLTHQMRAMSTAVDPIKDAANNVRYLREQATQMPFSLKTLTSGFTKLKAVGLDPTNGSMKAIADGIAAFGGSDESFNRTVLGITQAAGKGVLQMEELRQQIGESMPVAMNLLARSMGMTVGQLAKEISTGTVASIPALQKLTAELNRAYGGTSQRMMQTFSGQMTQLYTNLTNLATGEGGKGFFDQIKNQLRDINQFLSSDMAKTMATEFGQGLSQVIQWLREGISTLWQFRDEIVSTGKVLAYGFGAVAAVRGLTTLRTALQTTIMELKLLAPALAPVRNNFAIAATGFRNFGADATAASAAARGMGGVVAIAASGLATLAPWIAAAGIAAFAASEYFGLLSDKTKEAYEELVKYGAESRKQAEETIGAREKLLMDRIEAMRRASTMASPGAWTKQIEEAEAELAKLREAAPKLIGDAGKREVARDLEAYKNELSDTLESFQREYNKTAIERDKQYNEEVNAEGEKEESRKQIRDRYIRDQMAQQKLVSTKTIDFYDQQIAEVERLHDAADESERAKYRSRLDFLERSRVAEVQKLNAITPENFEMEYSKGSASETKEIKAGQTALDNLKQDIAGLQANINGASGAVAEMNERIAQGDFGSIKEGGAEVEKLHNELRAAAEAKEALDKVMKGNQKADQDLQRIKEDVAEKQLELLERQRGRELNDAQKMQLKLENGGYFGLGPYENIKKAINGITGAMNEQGAAAENVAAYIRQNAFGEQTIQQVDKVTQRMLAMRDAILGIGTGLRGLNFAGMGVAADQLTTINGMSGGAFSGMAGFGNASHAGANLMSKNMARWGDPRTPGWQQQNLTSISAGGLQVQVHKAAAESFQGFLNELISKGYNVKSLGGYNLRNKISGGSLSEHAFGNAIDINPAQNPYGKNLVTDMPPWISELAAKYNLSWGGDWKSVKDAMHFEWRGQQGPGPAVRDTQQPSAVQQFQPVSVDTQVAKTENLNKELADASAAYTKIAKQNSDLDLSDWIKETEAQTKDLGDSAEETGKRYNQLRKAIVEGKFDKAGNPEDRNPEAERFKAALDAAKRYDAAAKQVRENQKLDKSNENEKVKFEERRVELNRRIAEMQNKVKDPKWVPDSSELQKLQTDLDGYVAAVLQRAGGNVNDGAYKQALETRRNLLAGQRRLEALDAQVSFNKETQELKNSLLTQTQLRQKSMQEELARVDTWLQQQRKNGADEVEIVRLAEEQKALIRQKYQQEMNPMQKQFAEWGDLQGQLAQKSAQWMDSLAGGITDLIMGTGDLKSVLTGILKDMVNMGVKYMMSGMFNKGGQQSSGGKNLFQKGASAATGGKAKVGTAHTGGIIGSSSLIPKMASASMFKGAAKYHTGGIVDGLLPSEVPIIAKKGEGVFTAEQMEMMGGFSQSQQFNFNSPITVQGSAGTPEQNSDLAKKMAREYEQSMRGMVADEIRKQSRPGNFMNQRSR